MERIRGAALLLRRWAFFCVARYAAAISKVPRGAIALAMPGRLRLSRSQFRLISRPVVHTRSVHALELKIPPVALVIIAAALMWLGAAYMPGLSFEFPFRAMVALVFGLLGLVTCSLGVVEFKRAKTTVNPTKPESSSSLVTSGIYRRTRNPMYLGLLLMLSGWAAAKRTWSLFWRCPSSSST